MIYKSDDLIVAEVAGGLNFHYCSRLCLLSKLFLNEKVEYQRMSSFVFYIAYTVNATGGAQFVGYFSKVHVYAHTQSSFKAGLLFDPSKVL